MKPAKQPNYSALLTKRLLYSVVACSLLLTTAGCSTIMGFFGAETKVNAAPADDAARMLVPTPTTEVLLAIDMAPPTPPASEPVATVEPPVESVPTPVIELAPAPPQTTQVIITGPSVNVRSAPSLDGQILRTVSADTRYELAGKNETGDWLQVCCIDGVSGWVFGELARLEEPPVTAAPATMATTPVVARLPGEQLPPATHPVASLPADAITYPYEDDNFSIALPSQWLPIMAGGELIESAMVTLGNENPAVAALLTEQLAKLSRTPLALLAFSLAPESLANGYMPSVSILKQPLPAGVTLDLFVQFSGSQLEQILGLSTPTAASNVQTGAGEALLLTYQMNESGIAARQYMILQNDTVYIVTFTSSISQAEADATTFAAIVNSFTVLAD